jgi:hypothetical protein
MKRYIFNVGVYFLPLMGFSLLNASDKLDFSDFSTEKNQRNQIGHTYYSTCPHQYLGVNFDEELAVFSNSPEEKSKMYPYYSTYQYLGVDLDGELAVFRNVPQKKSNMFNKIINGTFYFLKKLKK